MVRPELAVAFAVRFDARLTTSCALAAGAVIDTVGGAGAATTVTDTAVDVATALLESVALAFKLKTPSVDGVQLAAYGLVVSVPSKVAPLKNSTLLIVRPELAVAFAVTFATVLTITFALAAGAVIVTVGGAGAAITVTDTAVEVVAALVESVALAVKETAPVAVGVHVKAYGLLVSVPNKVAPEKNSTLLMVRPELAAAFAVTFAAVLTANCALAAGAVSNTVGGAGAAITVTDTAIEVVT